MNLWGLLYALASQHPPLLYAHSLPLLCPLLLLLSHFHLSSLCGLKAVLAVTVHFPVKEAFIAAGTGTLAHLLTTEGFGFTTPSPWATHF